jgi:putative oxidoreductase
LGAVITEVVMERLLGRHAETIYGIMRIVVGFLFASHGAQKLFGAFGGPAMTGSPLMLTAGLIEFFGGLLVAVGFAAGIAAFITSGQMAVAYFMAHAGHGVWPIVNHGELAVVYCFVFLFIAARGSGKLSVDALRRPRDGRT